MQCYIHNFILHLNEMTGNIVQAFCWGPNGIHSTYSGMSVQRKRERERDRVSHKVDITESLRYHLVWYCLKFGFLGLCLVRRPVLFRFPNWLQTYLIGSFCWIQISCLNHLENASNLNCGRGNWIIAFKYV